jgi:arginyl-tRNA synthetase
MTEKEELLKKLIEINIIDINERAKNLHVEFQKSYQEQEMDDDELEEILKSAQKIREEMQGFINKIDNVREVKEIIGIFKSFS